MIPVKTALCSYGLSGRVFHAPFLHLHPGFELYAVWERSKALAAVVYPSIQTYRTLEEILNDPAVELVVVNTPSYTHFEYTKKALTAGKHVVVEKPFAGTVAEAEELANLARRSGKMLSIFQNRRYDSDYKTVKKIIEEGWLGKISEAEIHYDRYNLQLSPKAHKETPGPAVGIVFDLGSHLIDQALQLFGMPEAVFADLGIFRPHSRVEDYMEVLLYYPGLRVRLRSGYMVREPLPAYIIYGINGTFLKSRADVQEQQLLEGKTPAGEEWGREPDSESGLLHTEKDGKLIRERIPTLRGNYREYYDGVYEAIRQPGTHQAPVLPEEGIRTTQIIDAAYRSNKEKKLIYL